MAKNCRCNFRFDLWDLDLSTYDLEIWHIKRLRYIDMCDENSMFLSSFFLMLLRFLLFWTMTSVTLTFRPMTFKKYTVLRTDQRKKWQKFRTSGCIFAIVIESQRRILSFRVSVSVTLTFDLMTLKNYTVLENLMETNLSKFHVPDWMLSTVIAWHRISHVWFCDLDLWPFDLDLMSTFSSYQY